MVFIFHIELGVGEIDPDPGGDVAAVVVALAQESVIVDFNGSFFLALLPGKLDNFRSSFLGLHVAVRTEFAVSHYIGGFITSRAVH
jgi:hypothetical protein